MQTIAVGMSIATVPCDPNAISAKIYLGRNLHKVVPEAFRKTSKGYFVHSQLVISIGTRFTAFPRRKVPAPLLRSCPQQAFEAAEGLRVRTAEADGRFCCRDEVSNFEGRSSAHENRFLTASRWSMASKILSCSDDVDKNLVPEPQA